MAHRTDRQSVLDPSPQIVEAGSNAVESPDDSIAATAEGEIYCSLPLVDTKSTRVLRILPPELQDGDNIICELEVISLDNDPPPEYCAVSYVWGSPSETRHIIVNNVPFVVRENLWAFLDNSRKRDFRGLLWTDAICIDQTSIPERNHQVSMMGNIYRSATRVLVWLGLESAIVPSVSDELQRSSEEMPSFEEYHQAGPLDSMRLMADNFVEHQLMLVPTAENLEETMQIEEKFFKEVFSQRHVMLCFLMEKVEQLFRVEYWKRIWVVQEYVLAREVVLQTDRSEMTGVELKAIFEVTLHAIGKDCQFPGADLDLADRLASLPAAVQMITSNLNCTNLTALIKTFADRNCSDQRDHIYALLSLAEPDQLAAFELSPDYSKSALELYIELTYRLVKALGFAKSMHTSEHAFGKALGIDPEVGRWIFCLVQNRVKKDNRSGRCSSAKEVAEEITRMGVQPPSTSPKWRETNLFLSRWSRADMKWEPAREGSISDADTESDPENYAEARRAWRAERAQAKLQREHRSPVDSDESM